MVRSIRQLGAGLAFVALSAVATTPAQSQDAASFYIGKTLRVVIPYSSGGLYSTFGVLLARHLQDNMPGKPSVIAQHMPGAGGVTALNHVYNVAPKDGLTVITPAAGIVTLPLLKPGSVRYDPAKFNYLGGWGEAVYTMTVFHTAPVKSLKQALATEVIFGTTGTSSLNYQLPFMVQSLLDAKIKLVTGYRGGGPVRIAMERGEVHGFSGNYLGWISTRPQWLRENKLIHLVQFGSKRASALKDVPVLMEFAKNDEQRAVMQFVADTGIAAFTLVAAPDVRAARLDALEQAYLATLKSPAFLAEAGKLGFPIEPVGRKEVTEAVARMTAASPATLATVRRVMGYTQAAK